MTGLMPVVAPIDMVIGMVVARKPVILLSDSMTALTSGAPRGTPLRSSACS